VDAFRANMLALHTGLESDWFDKSRLLQDSVGSFVMRSVGFCQLSGLVNVCMTRDASDVAISMDVG